LVPIANSFIFYLWRIYDVFRNAFQGLCLALRYRRIAARVETDPARMSYPDEALTPLERATTSSRFLSAKFRIHMALHCAKRFRRVS
jgi:hypothetical protein